MKRLSGVYRTNWQGLVVAASSLVALVASSGTSHAQWVKDGEFQIVSYTFGATNPVPAGNTSNATINGYSAAPTVPSDPNDPNSPPKVEWPATAAPTVHADASRASSSNSSQAYGGIGASADESVMKYFKWVGTGTPTAPNVEMKLTLAVSATSTAGNTTWGASSAGQYKLFINQQYQDVTASNRVGSTSYVGNQQSTATSKNYSTPSQDVTVGDVYLRFEDTNRRSLPVYIYTSVAGYNLGMNSQGQSNGYAGSADSTVVVTKIDGVSQ